MNTAALKTFAPAVRRQLMEAVTRKLDFALSAQTPDYLTTFAPQVAALRKLEQADRHGLIERVAYTWFNRFTALRFLDARSWHPFRARVLTPASASETQPELLKLTRTGALPEDLRPHTDPERLNNLLDGRIPSPDAQGEVYRHLVLAACRFYNALLPDLFEKLDDETELLLPDDLLTEHSVVHGFRTEISDEDCGDEQRANVEILGWLYQFYISERKDKVMARKSAVPTEDIPAVTQLFTPHWIVRYLVENSLGRLWLLNRPDSKLREHMPYYIEGEAETDFLKITKPQEIRLLDPAAGSGHMLTYAFDLLTLIYEEEGYAPSEIPAFILRHNLHGLEICPRAAQLAEMALVFKARENSRRFFQPEHLVQPNVIALRDVSFAEDELREYIAALGLGGLFNGPMLKLLHQFDEATTFGSLIQPCLDEKQIAFARCAIEAKDLGSQLFLRETHLKVLRALEQAEAITQRYQVVVANPPYMGTKQMAPRLKAFGQECYPDAKADTFAMFIEQALMLVQKRGFAALVTMQSWMFLGSFEALRRKIIAHHRVSTMAHLGPRAFDSIPGEIVQVSAFVLQAEGSGAAPGMFLRLITGANEAEKEELLRRALGSQSDILRFTATRSDFEAIPSEPIAYWLTPIIRETFRTGKALKDIANPTGGMTTGNNEQFLRLWHEVSTERIGFGLKDRATAKASMRKWFPYNKGGEFRKWFGNANFVVNWKNDGQEIIATGRATPRSRDYYFHRSITYSATGSFFGARHSDEGFIFDAKGASCFAGNDDHLWVLGFLTTQLTSFCLGALNPTVEFQTGDLAKLPLAKKVFEKAFQAEATMLVEECVSIARADWDNFVTSWNFLDHPLLRPGLKGATLEASWRNWEKQCVTAICRMQELETENNRLFIAAYDLEDELLPEVSEKQITLARADARRDMADFLSYAVGCMMGRYSLDQPGLILANAGDSLSEYLAKVGRPPDQLTFAPDEDGIIPVLDGEWFEDDIVARTRDFLRATFGEATLRENIRFIDESLGKDLRSYFVTDFYKDHLQTYKKRPIYWMVQSPRKGFSALLYLHRYTRDTMNLVLNRYLRDYQVKLRNRLAHLTEAQATATTARDKTAARQEADKLTKILLECEEWERQTVLPLAQARIELDLDDGVKTNYLRLGEALAPIPGLAAKEE